jgi:hypothetical protein
MNSILDYRASDGSRRFAELPQADLWYAVRDHVFDLEGAHLTGFVCDGVTEAWIDFEYCGHSFSINDQYGEYWFFVQDPTCPERVLMDVYRHFEKLLQPTQ